MHRLAGSPFSAKYSLSFQAQCLLLSFPVPKNWNGPSVRSPALPFLLHPGCCRMLVFVLYPVWLSVFCLVVSRSVSLSVFLFVSLFVSHFRRFPAVIRCHFRSLSQPVIRFHFLFPILSRSEIRSLFLTHFHRYPALLSRTPGHSFAAFCFRMHPAPSR